MGDVRFNYPSFLSNCALTGAVSDIIGFIQCDSLKGQSTPISGGGQSTLQDILYRLVC